MNPGFGAGVRRFIFEPMTPETYGRLTSAITSQISKFMRFVIVEDIRVITANEDIDLSPNSVRLQIKYNLGSVNDSDTLIITQNQY